MNEARYELSVQDGMKFVARLSLCRRDVVFEVSQGGFLAIETLSADGAKDLALALNMAANAAVANRAAREPRP